VRFLVAEPDPDVLALIERALAGWGHETVRFRGRAEPAEVDAMLFEPGMGERVVELAGELAGRRPPVPLVVVSIYPAEPSVRGLRPVAYLLKPFALHELEVAVEKAVARAAAGR
jgi:DNA-binding response OmpR family regulator